MKNNSSEVSTGVALLMTLGIMLLIGMIISACEPKCSLGGCDKDAIEGSNYCYLHDMSYRSYGNPDYNEVYRNSQNGKNSSTTSSSGSSSKSNTASGSGSKSNSSTKTTTKTTTKKYSYYSSYDEGYDDVYENDDYDWDRYYSDDDYADGVDDAMDELDW